MGVYLSTPKTEKASEDGENDTLKYGLSSMQGWRATMEDAHAAYSNLDQSTSFFGVYDGHGGKEVSRFCAKFLHQQVLEHEASGDLETSVKKAFLRMDEIMCQRTGQKELALLKGKVDISNGDGPSIPESNEDNRPADHWSPHEGPSAGSTACVAIIRNNQLLVANAGDSRCVISRNGKAHELSKDHKPDLAAEKKRILEAGGYVQYGRVNGSLNLTRAIGDMELKQNKSLAAEMQIVTAYPDVTTVELSEDDEFLVIACDGIWDCLSSQEAVDFVREQLKTVSSCCVLLNHCGIFHDGKKRGITKIMQEKKLSMVCERVLDRCLAPASGQEGCDNMTMILVQFKKGFNLQPSSHHQTETPVN